MSKQLVDIVKAGIISLSLSLSLSLCPGMAPLYAEFGGFSTPSGVVNITVRTGYAVALHCGVENSLPLPAIVWMKSGTLVDTSLPKYRVLDNAKYLVIYNLIDSDVHVGGVSVNYQCQVTNANASSTVTSPTTYNLIKTG